MSNPKQEEIHLANRIITCFNGDDYVPTQAIMNLEKLINSEVTAVLDEVKKLLEQVPMHPEHSKKIGKPEDLFDTKAAFDNKIYGEIKIWYQATTATTLLYEEQVDEIKARYQ